LTRCDQVPEEALKRIEEEICRINRDLVVARSIHVPVEVKTRQGAEIGLDQLRGKQLFAFCGIGNPRSFFRLIEHLGGQLVGSRVYDDHYRYAGGDLDQIRREAAAREASLILTTQKDWTKISRLAGAQDHPPVAYLAVELQISAGAQALTALIDRVLGSTMPTAG
jgi:tetraacyldisaccharide 4'-kinase